MGAYNYLSSMWLYNKFRGASDMREQFAEGCYVITLMVWNRTRHLLITTFAIRWPKQFCQNIISRMQLLLKNIRVRPKATGKILAQFVCGSCRFLLVYFILLEMGELLYCCNVKLRPNRRNDHVLDS